MIFYLRLRKVVPFHALFCNRWLETILLTRHLGLVLRENATWHYNGLAPTDDLDGTLGLSEVEAPFEDETIE